MHQGNEAVMEEENGKIVCPLLPYKTKKLSEDEAIRCIYRYLAPNKFDYKMVLVDGFSFRYSFIQVPYYVHLSNIIDGCITELFCDVEVLYHDSPLSKEYLEMTIEELFETKFKGEEKPMILVRWKLHVVFYIAFSYIYKSIANPISSAYKRFISPPAGYQKLEQVSDKD